MKKKKNKPGADGYEDHDPADPDSPSGKLIRISDFLPPPEELVFSGEETEKVTIVLKKASVDFFREKAKEFHTKYQRMIREVLDRYVSRYQ
jgi:hypothetical protein